jgi:hypothetical protein
MDLSKLSKPNQDNLLKFWTWMTQTGRAKIFQFSIHGDELFKLLGSGDNRGNLTTGMHRGMSDMIDDYLEVDPGMLDFFINHSTTADWTKNNQDLYACYRVLKAVWLSEDVAKNGIQAPMQLIQHGRNYRTHPGSDKKFVITYLNPQPNIPMFYIWYPELDPAPWIWTVSHREVRSPEEFCDMFVNAQHPTFRIVFSEITFTNEGAECTEEHLLPWAQGAHYSCQKYGKLNPNLNLTLPTVSYTDAVHRMGSRQEIKRIMKKIERTGDDVFWLGGDLKFIRYNGVWALERFLNFPVSLVDQDWCWDQSRAIYYDNTRPNISKHRMDM